MVVRRVCKIRLSGGGKAFRYAATVFTDVRMYTHLLVLWYEYTVPGLLPKMADCCLAIHTQALRPLVPIFNRSTKPPRVLFNRSEVIGKRKKLGLVKRHLSGGKCQT